MERLAGPGIAKRFLNLLLNDFQQEIVLICNYLNGDWKGKAIEEIDLLRYYRDSQLSLGLEEGILQRITIKAQNGDNRCIQFICNSGYEIGSALGVFMKHYQGEHFITHIKLAGSIGQFFGLYVKNNKKEDVFIEHIEKGILQALSSL